MKIIAMTNKKGGVGKTTTALSTAAYLGQCGFSVLAIDMDAERIVKEYIEGPTIFELVKNGTSATSYLAQARDM
ncbi:MAG: AAA family ATPase, partial [Schwartzia sp.]|nr:AAA family ATPase [Schwartzia sp. (in: firmicutes)]